MLSRQSRGAQSPDLSPLPQSLALPEGGEPWGHEARSIVGSASGYAVSPHFLALSRPHPVCSCQSLVGASPQGPCYGEGPSGNPPRMRASWGGIEAWMGPRGNLVKVRSSSRVSPLLLGLKA